jgi:hypothetical protein
MIYKNPGSFQEVGAWAIWCDSLLFDELEDSREIRVERRKF